MREIEYYANNSKGSVQGILLSLSSIIQAYLIVLHFTVLCFRSFFLQIEGLWPLYIKHHFPTGSDDG